MTDYSLRLIKPSGDITQVPPTYTNLSYSKAVNAVGALTLRFLENEGKVDADMFTEDTQLQVWRTPTRGRAYVDMDALWFVTSAIVTVGNDRTRQLEVKAASALDLAARRLIAYSSGSAQATVNGPADDMIKRIASENLGSSAIAARIISSLSVQGNASLGATVNKQIGWRGLLQSMQEIAKDSDAAGTPVYFDIVAAGTSGEIELRTWTSQPGAVISQPIFSLENGSLRSASWGYDRSDQINVVYGLGQEFQGARQMVTATDPSMSATPFSRRETSIDARNAVLTSELQGEANAEMARRKPKAVVIAEASNAGSAPYGAVWKYGDRLSVSVGGRQYSCLVEAVQVDVNRSTEQIRATLRF